MTNRLSPLNNSSIHNQIAYFHCAQFSSIRLGIRLPASPAVRGWIEVVGQAGNDLYLGFLLETPLAGG